MPRVIIYLTLSVHGSLAFRYFAALQDLGLRTVRLMLRALELPEDQLGACALSVALVYQLILIPANN